MALKYLTHWAFKCNTLIHVYDLTEHILRPHPELWRLLAEIGKGIAQRMLRLHHVVEVVGERPGQSQHILVFPFSISQHLNLGLQLQVYSPGTSAETL